jgi:RND superfamily putative drug exporter
MLREQYSPNAFAGAPAVAYVGGLTSEEVDLLDTTSAYQPWVIAIVLGLSFILLTMVFRSIVVPIKAIIMNLLSVGAAYGILVLVFQKGFLNEIFGLQETPFIQPWLRLMLFTILFGLSMDYQVFLISRIREKYDETGDNTASVAFGIRSTAGLITGAALIMVAVFGGFAAGDLVTTSQFGFGLAVAILIDATIVRTVLVPSTMKLLGDRNWYLPSFLNWLPDVRVEGGAPAPEPVGGDD